MKKLFFILSFLITFILSSQSQVPDKFNYQATLRDNSGLLLVSKDIKVKISILKSDILGNTVYTETHSVKTTEQGVINLHIGAGSTSDDLALVNWYDGPYFLKIEIDPEGGDSFIHFGTSEILSVPLAISSKKAGSVEWDNVQNKPAGVTGSYSDLSDKPAIPTNISELNNDAGFITDFNETDPVFNNSAANSISSALIENWNNAYHWGNHAVAGYTKYPTLDGNSGKYLMTNGTLTYWDYAVNSANGPLYVNNNIMNIQKATSLSNGYLSSTDWNAFNNKISSQWKNLGNNIFYNDGNVGIGTDNPVYKLNVVSTSTSYDNESRNIVLIRNLSSDYSAFASLVLRADDNSHGVSLSFTSTNYSLIEDMKSSASLGTNGNALALSTTSENGSIRFLSNPYQSGLIEMMRLDVNGNLGLGTKTPHAKLEIANGDVYIKDINKGIIMTSPDGQCWKGTINNSGTLEFVTISCP